MAASPPVAHAGITPPGRRRWLVLAVVAVAQLMVVLDTSIVNIALPSAQRNLGFTDDWRRWVVIGYALAFGSLLLLGGRIADLVGRRNTFLVGLAGFATASAIGGAAPTVEILIIARVLQGVFAALLAPSALSLLTTTFPTGPERTRALGVYSAFSSAGASTGLLLGGALTEYLGWRWCMYVNLVFAGFCLTMGWRVLDRRATSVSRPRLDVPGAAIVSVALFCLVYGCSLAETSGWRSPVVLVLIGVGIVALAAFVVRQTRTSHPLLPMRILFDRNRGSAFLTILASGAAMFTISLFLTYFLQQNLGFSPILSGLGFLPMVLAIAITSTIGNSLLLPLLGPRILLAGGPLVAAGGLVWLALLGVDSTYFPNIFGPLLLIGLGMGLSIATAISTATSGVDPGDSGVASATVSTMQQIGGSLGTAVFTSVAAGVTSANAVGGAVATVAGYTTAFAGGAAVLTAGAVVAAVAVRPGRRVQSVELAVHV